MCDGLRAKCLLFLSEFNQNPIFFFQILVKVLNMKMFEISVLWTGRAEGLGQPTCRSEQLICESACRAFVKKGILGVQTELILLTQDMC